MLDSKIHKTFTRIRQIGTCNFGIKPLPINPFQGLNKTLYRRRTKQLPPGFWPQLGTTESEVPPG